MHECTLHRRLRKHGASYRQKLESIRYEVNRQLLADTTLPLVKIAYRRLAEVVNQFLQDVGALPAL